MKLLIVTQNVDRTDPIMGFFSSWVEAFAERTESVIVVGQKVGEYSFPRNVSVESLGKEIGKDIRLQILRSYVLFWRYRKNYDAVFVHMTPIWIIIGAPLWFLLRKRMYLWYEIKRGSLKLNIALRLVRKVFAATEHGIPGSSRKLMIVGHGIDTDAFAFAKTYEKDLVVAIGRMTRIKNYDVILRTFAELPVQARLFIAGGTITKADKTEEKRIQDLAQKLAIDDRIEICWVAPDEIPSLLQRARLFLHASQGGLDKALLQAMSCGCPIVSTSNAAQDVLPQMCQSTEDSMAEKARVLFDSSSVDRQTIALQLRSTIESKHSLPQCIDRLVEEMQSY